MPKLMSVKEIAEYLGLSERTAYKMIKGGRIPYLKLGGQFRFRQDQIEEWLEKKSQMLPKIGLDKVKETKDPLTKRLLFVGLLTRALESQDVRPIVVGGNAVEFYTAGGYSTGDIDIVAPSEPVDEVLRKWNFRKEGRHWISEELDIFIEAPSSSLEEEAYERVSEVEIDDLKVYIIGIEDLIIDRLNAYIHWKSLDDKRWAEELVALHLGEIDWDYLEKRSEEEKTSEALLEIKKDLVIDEKG